MKHSGIASVSIALCLLVTSSVIGRGTYSQSSPLAAIQADYEAGQISLDQKVNFYIDAIKAPSKLPGKYTQPLAQSTQPIECPTTVLCEIRSVWDQLLPETQQRFSEAFARFDTEFKLVTPSGFFTIHYDTSGSDAVPNADVDSDNIPDYIEHISAYLDSSLNKHIALGYLLPPSDDSLGGDSTYDVYFEEMGFYGYALPEGSGSAPWADSYSHLTLNRNFLGFPPNNDPEGDQLGAAKATIAHEFHHSVTFAYSTALGKWYMELDATCMEDIVFDASDDNYNYLPDFFSTPQTSLMEQSIHMYASFPWGLYVSQKFDTSLLRAVWEGAKPGTGNEFTILSDSLSARYGWSMDSAFAEFAIWNYMTNTRNDGLHHAEASAYPLITVAQTHSSYPVTLQNSPVNPAGYGVTYIDFYPGASIGKLRITVDGDNVRQWKFYLILSPTNSTHSVSQIQAVAPEYNGSIDILGFENYHHVTLVAINLSEFSPPSLFTYSATVFPPYAVASALLTDSAVYSGGYRNFRLKLINPSILPDVYSVFVSDDLGWLPLDTIFVPVAANHDSTIIIPVHPPIGTPLNMHSTLRFIPRSWGDTTVTDTQSIVAVTKLQRGDENFTGTVNILDLLYLISFLFNGGPAPQPVVLAGDFNCNNGVTISDLTAQVRYLFQNGPKPTCNPF